MNETLATGYAARPITPATPVEMCGYGVNLGRHAQRVLDELFVRVVVVEHGSARMVFFSYDLIGFSPEFSDMLRGRVAHAIDTTADRVAVICTHTHSGPPTATLRGMGTADPEYTSFLVETTLEAVQSAVSALTPSQFVFASLPIEPIGFNRVERSFNGIDPNVSICGFIPWREKTEDSKDDTSVKRPIVLVHYACHPVSLGVNDEISADFPGRVTHHLDEAGIDAAFIQGFCGNINPMANSPFWGSGTESDIDRYGSHICERVTALLRVANPVPLTGESFDGRCYRVSLPLDVSHSPESHVAKLTNAYASFGEDRLNRFITDWRQDWDELCERNPEDRIIEVPVQILTIGTVRFACVGAEVFSTIGNRLKEKFDDVVAVGYANGVVGYVPDSAAFERPTDYAAYLAPHFFAPAPFTPDAPDILTNALLQYLDKEKAQ
jgi:neutral ceramidase